VLDDWGLLRLTGAQQRDRLELLDDRHQERSTIATSQLPLGSWHETLANPTLADAILDRLIHNAHRIELKGESMRKQRSDLHQSGRLVT
jgi:DNA replication protein DnaC